MDAALKVFSGRPWIPAGYTAQLPQARQGAPAGVSGSDWNTRALAVPVLKRAVSGNGSISLPLSGVLRAAGEEKLQSWPSLDC